MVSGREIGGWGGICACACRREEGKQKNKRGDQRERIKTRSEKEEVRRCGVGGERF